MRDRYERKHRRTWRHPAAVAMMAGATAVPFPECEAVHLHTPDQPIGYNAWHGWAERMMQTHRQERCPVCGLYQIWVAK